MLHLGHMKALLSFHRQDLRLHLPLHRRHRAQTGGVTTRIPGCEGGFADWPSATLTRLGHAIHDSGQTNNHEAAQVVRGRPAARRIRGVSAEPQDRRRAHEAGEGEGGRL